MDEKCFEALFLIKTYKNIYFLLKSNIIFMNKTRLIFVILNSESQDGESGNNIEYWLLLIY
ncbi:hypothetical protein MYMA111404_00855 [Mycoplasma marinum]|uniref:Uncharacterized protein n=1 Tax=Mycoplasma marinum TaxID=1937190 RepID=A0A4R0XVT7_9MOLU|nr:hypothetical protein C4B24_00010 [Mycoplasma marinum]